MNEMNSWEGQLRSWTPRRPSPKIERRLFSQSPQSPPLPRLVGIFAPVAACLVLTLIGASRIEPPFIRGTGPEAAMVAMSLSNQSFAPYLPGNAQSAANRWDTFEWTNGGYSQSSVRSFKHSEALDLE